MDIRERNLNTTSITAQSNNNIHQQALQVAAAAAGLDTQPVATPNMALGSTHSITNIQQESFPIPPHVYKKTTTAKHAQSLQKNFEDHLQALRAASAVAGRSKEWQELCKQGIEQAQHLVSNKSESASSIISLELGSTHSITTNMDLSKFTQTEISHVKQAFQHYTVESLGLESELTISTPVITQKIDENDKQRCVVTCKIVEASTQPVVKEVVDESTQNGEINVSAFNIGTTNKRFHDSLYIHIEEYSSAMLSLVDNLGEVASLEKAEVVDCTKYSENTRWEVVYSKMEKVRYVLLC